MLNASYYMWDYEGLIHCQQTVAIFQSETDYFYENIPAASLTRGRTLLMCYSLLELLPAQSCLLSLMKSV